jgi:integrase
MNGGKQSLYLDFYPAIQHPDTGKQTRREFLRLHIWDKPKNDIEKNHNKETLGLAENIAAKRQIAVQNLQYGFLSTEKQEHDFVEYFEEMADKRAGTNFDNWYSALNYIKAFTGGKLQFANLTLQWCNDFKKYLLNAPTHRSAKAKLSQNSALSYFNKLRATLKQAYKDGYLLTDLNSRLEGIKEEETKREYLTLEELQRLVDTDCSPIVLKAAALFSALTGLRFSDIQKLTWGEVKQSEADGHYLEYQQKKTKGFEVLPISEQAHNLLGGRGNDDDKVFVGLVYSAWVNAHLVKWVARAGVKKDITFHSFRHTYATLQLSLGTSIYTVSKMLGHRDLKTTQIYAKIVDEDKRNAADKIKLNF